MSIKDKAKGFLLASSGESHVVHYKSMCIYLANNEAVIFMTINILSPNPLYCNECFTGFLFCLSSSLMMSFIAFIVKNNLFSMKLFCIFFNRLSLPQ